MRHHAPLLALLVLLTLVPAASAQDAPYLDWDVQDPAGDLVVDPRDRDAPSRIGEHAAIDLLRYTVKVEGEDVVQTFTFAGDVGEAGSSFESVVYVGESAGAQMRYAMSWRNGASGGSGKADFIAPGTIKEVPVRESVEGNVITLRFAASEIAGVPCFVPTGYADASDADAGYNELWSPNVNPCSDPGVRLDGADGECAAPAGATDDLARAFRDAEGDVAIATMSGGSEPADEPSLDILSYGSRVEGATVVVEVETAAAIGDEGGRIDAIHSLDGNTRETEEEPQVLQLRYERFVNGTRDDLIDAWTGVEDADGSQRARFPVWAERDGATVRFTFCASVVPAERDCFSPHVATGRTLLFAISPEDLASASPDPCAAARAAVATREAAGEAAEDLEDGLQEELEGEADAANESPVSPGLVLVALVGAAALAGRRALSR